jgi:drug/metabolite transporter (DMT)-like permease
MTAILLALGAAGAWGVSDTLGGHASRGRHVLAVMLLTRVAGLVLVAAVVPAIGAPWIGGDWPYAVVAGLALLAAIVCLYRALAIGPMSVVAPIFATGAAVPVLWGVAGGEVPGAATFVGLLVALGGCVLTARAPASAGMAPDRRGLVLASGAALLIGVGLTLMDRAGEHGALSAILVERATEAVVLVVLVAVLRRRVAADLRRPGAVPLVGWIDVSAASLYVLATQEGLLPVVSVLASLYPAVTVLLARLFLGERLSRTQALGAALTLAGVALVAGTG